MRIVEERNNLQKIIIHSEWDVDFQNLQNNPAERKIKVQWMFLLSQKINILCEMFTSVDIT